MKNRVILFLILIGIVTSSQPRYRTIPEKFEKAIEIMGGVLSRRPVFLVLNPPKVYRSGNKICIGSSGFPSILYSGKNKVFVNFGGEDTGSFYYLNDVTDFPVAKSIRDYQLDPYLHRLYLNIDMPQIVFRHWLTCINAVEIDAYNFAFGTMDDNDFPLVYLAPSTGFGMHGVFSEESYFGIFKAYVELNRGGSELSMRIFGEIVSAIKRQIQLKSEKFYGLIVTIDTLHTSGYPPGPEEVYDVIYAPVWLQKHGYQNDVICFDHRTGKKVKLCNKLVKISIEKWWPSGLLNPQLRRKYRSEIEEIEEGVSPYLSIRIKRKMLRGSSFKLYSISIGGGEYRDVASLRGQKDGDYSRYFRREQLFQTIFLRFADEVHCCTIPKELLKGK